jgi:hypothetical protein
LKSPGVLPGPYESAGSSTGKEEKGFPFFVEVSCFALHAMTSITLKHLTVFSLNSRSLNDTIAVKGGVTFLPGELESDLGDDEKKRNG